MKRMLMSGVAAIVLPGAAFANCPAISVADMQGVAPGAYPQQYELAEFQSAAGCERSFSENPDIARLNGMINWYRASPLLVPKPGEPLQELPSWPKEKMMVRCPHLLIWGLGDKALLPEVTDGLEEFAPDLTRIEMEDVDHWLCHQKPHEVAAHILNWTAT